MNFTLDFDKYREEINQVSINLLAMKKDYLRKPHENITKVAWAMQRTAEDKKWATLLCSLRAWHRNKVHVQGWTLEEQEKYLVSNMDKWIHLAKPIEEEEAVEAVYSPAA